MTERKDTNGDGRPKARRMGTRPKVQCFVGSMFSAERSKRGEWKTVDIFGHLDVDVIGQKSSFHRSIFSCG